MGVWSVLIAGVERRSRIEWPSVTVQQILTSQVDTMSFTMRLPDDMKRHAPSGAAQEPGVANP